MALPVPVGPEPNKPTPRPPSDGSGGLIIMGVARGLEMHTMRFHIRPFNYNSPVNNSFSTVGGATITVENDYAYTSEPTPSSGGQTIETHVGETISNLRDMLSAFYNSDWVIGTLDLWGAVVDAGYISTDPTIQDPDATRLFKVAPLPRLSVKTVLGVNGTASSSPSSMIDVNLQTRPRIEGGQIVGPPGRGRVTLLDSAEWDHSGHAYKTSGDFNTGWLLFGGTATPLTELVGYLGNSTDCPVASAIVAHNGLPFVNEAKITNRMYNRSVRTINRAAMVA